MASNRHKQAKQGLGWLETTFFRFFAPISAVGAATLGAETFIIQNAHFFFLLLPLIDAGRCALYFTKDHGGDSIEKQRWNKAYYGLKVLMNITACLCMVLGYALEMTHLIVPGQALFIGGVAGSTTIQYIIKSFGGLSDNRSTNKEDRDFKNRLFAITMIALTGAMSMLMFFPHVTFAHEPLGWLLVIIGNTIPVAGFAMHSRDPYLVLSTAILLSGIALLWSAPHSSFGLDHKFNTEVGVGLGLVLAGFTISTVRGVYQWYVKHQEKEEKKIMPDDAHSENNIEKKENTKTPDHAPSRITYFISYFCGCYGGGASENLNKKPGSDP